MKNLKTRFMEFAFWVCLFGAIVAFSYGMTNLSEHKNEIKELEKEKLRLEIEIKKRQLQQI